MRLMILASLIFSTAPSTIHAEPPCDLGRWQPLITEAASRFEIPALWVRAVLTAESAGCLRLNRQPTASDAGAMGLMQLMPTTWRTYRERLSLGDNAYDPRDNILAGSAYLRDLYDRFGWPGAAAAYHAGPQRYEASLTHAKPLPEATLEYLARIDRAMTRGPRKRSQSSSSESEKDGALFVELRGKNQPKRDEPSDSSDVQDR